MGLVSIYNSCNSLDEQCILKLFILFKIFIFLLQNQDFDVFKKVTHIGQDAFQTVDLWGSLWQLLDLKLFWQWAHRLLRLALPNGQTDSCGSSNPLGL